MGEPNPNPNPNEPSNPFEGITFPDKFLKDGKPDLPTFVNSYGELETKWNTKTEDLKKTLRDEIVAETAKNRPKDAASYELKAPEGIDAKELGEHPLTAWWREKAFATGLDQAGFDEGIAKYLEAITPAEPDMAAVQKALGDNHAARISQVETWAKSYAKNDGEMKALQGIATSAEGIMLIERLAGLKPDVTGGGGGGGSDALTIESLRKMQEDPRYWDPSKRDEKFVKEVTDGYEKLYVKK